MAWLLKSRSNRGDSSVAKTFSNAIYRAVSYNSGPTNRVSQILQHCPQGVEHRQHKGLNNQAEKSHQPTRLRERHMVRFKSFGHDQYFFSDVELIRQHFHSQQHQLRAQDYQEQIHQRLASLRDLTDFKLLLDLSQLIPPGKLYLIFQSLD